MVAIQIFINLEAIVQKVILDRVLMMLMILVPAHDKWEGVTVMMDQSKVRLSKGSAYCTHLWKAT